MNYKELQEQLYSLLTEEEKKKGYCYVTYDIGVSTMMLIGKDDIECVFSKSPYRNHIIGFKRREYGIDLILDEEGQKKWYKAEREAAEWMSRFGCD